MPGNDDRPQDSVDFRLLFESAPDLYWVVRPHDYRIVAVSNAFLRGTGMCREAVVGRILFDAFPGNPDDPASIGDVDSLRRSLDTVRKYRREDRLVAQRYSIHRPGSDSGEFEERYWTAINTPVFDHAGELRYILHRTEDVTEQVRLRERDASRSALETRVERVEADLLARAKELKRSNEHLRFAQEVTQLGSWEFHLGDGSRYWSDEVYRILGIAPDFISESTDPEALIAAIVHPDDQPLIREARERLLQGENIETLEHRIVRGDGMVRHVRERVEMIRDDNGRPLRMFGTVQDITEYRRTHDRLENIEELMRIAGRMAKLGAWQWSIAEQLITWSDEVCDVHGIEPCESLPFDEAVAFMAPEWSSEAIECLNACAQNGTPFDMEYEIVTVSGERRWVRSIGRPVRGKTGTIEFVQGAMQDVTERRRAQASEREGEKRTRQILQNALDAVVSMDSNDTIIAWNRQAETTFGWSREEALGKNLSGLIIPRQYREAHRRGVAHFLATGEGPLLNRRVEVTALHRDGREFPVELAISALRTEDGFNFSAFIRDITDRRESDDQLREQAALLDKAREAIIVLDLEGRITYWNKASERMYGWSSEEACGRFKYELLDEDKERFAEALRTVRETGEWTDEILQHTRDGKDITVEATWSLVMDEEDRPQAIFSIINDITERLALQEQLRQSQRLESIGQLTGGVAHDFNNLLTVILGNNELLVDRLPDESPLQRLAEMSRDAALRGSDLTHRLLAFARRQALAPKIVDVNDLVRGMESLLRRTLPETISLRVIPARDTWPAYIDPSQLESVLLNLALNAKDAMPRGGSLTLETENSQLDAQYTDANTDVEPGDYVLIAVSDTGSGIDPEIVDRVFDPFFTTKEKGKGTGLGLSMAYGFTKQSHGHIKIYSEPDEGTTVRLYLPRAGTDRMQGATPSGDVAHPAGSEAVLVVEDDDMVREHACQQLELLGYDVIAASDGPEALRVLERDIDIELLFTDVIMSGGMNGPELAAEARRRRPELKVLYTSGYTENAIVHHGRLDPGVHLLQKPYQRAELAHAVRRVLAGRTHDGTSETGGD